MFCNIYRKIPVLEPYFDKAKVSFSRIIKKRLQHICFLVNITKSLKTPTSKNICKQLLLTKKCSWTLAWSAICSKDFICYANLNTLWFERHNHLRTYDHLRTYLYIYKDLKLKQGGDQFFLKSMLFIVVIVLIFVVIIMIIVVVIIIIVNVAITFGDWSMIIWLLLILSLTLSFAIIYIDHHYYHYHY